MSKYLNYSWGKFTPCEANNGGLEQFKGVVTVKAKRSPLAIATDDKSLQFEVIKVDDPNIYSVYIKRLNNSHVTVNNVAVIEKKYLLNGDVISTSPDGTQSYTFNMILDCATTSNVLPSVLHDRFVLGATINSTDMRKLCFAFHKKSCAPYAVKIFPKKTPFSEIRKLMDLKVVDHANLMEIVHVAQTKDCVFLVQRYVEDFIRLEQIVETPTMSFVFGQIVAAVFHLHEVVKVTHGRLKPSSVFISKGFLPIVKVNDHGLSHVVPTSMLIEDPDFVAPELLTGAGSFNPQVDIWSLGELLYYMLFKTPPFNNHTSFPGWTKLDILLAHPNISYQLKELKSADVPIQALLFNTLQVEPKSRPNIKVISKANWFTVRIFYFFAAILLQTCFSEVLNDTTRIPDLSNVCFLSKCMT
ncbi:ovarian-specific serine/threonine-protein kinase Lok-like isoform X1 [Tenebrio molitor]|uniref:ovarian-specific serine/threonine-protein kinase Lok-like isoform X1 n=1 Tax=Tenebrio molitor TaxID=7067 RepID=UPI00362490F1